MSSFPVFFALMFNFLILWALIEHSGQNFLKIFRKKTNLIIFISGFFYLYQISGIFLTMVMFEATLFCIYRRFKDKKQLIDRHVFVNELILIMTSGHSFDSSLSKISSEKMESVKTDQNFLKVMSFCQKNSSLSLKALKFYRDIEQLRIKLLDQEKNVSLQAKAQAIISFVLFMIVLLVQWMANPSFQKMFHTFEGKSLLLMSFGWLSIGLWLVFKLSKTKNMEI